MKALRCITTLFKMVLVHFKIGLCAIIWFICLNFKRSTFQSFNFQFTGNLIFWAVHMN